MTSSPVRITSSELVALRGQACSLPARRGNVRTLNSGLYHSAFKGRGMEFDEVRSYQDGDDIRNLDWRVTARTGKVHTKLFHEERERPVHLWVDYRSPMFFATQGSFKSVLAAQAATFVAWSATQQGDRLGGLVFSETDHLEMRPEQGSSAALKFIRLLVDHPAWNRNASAARREDAAQWSLARLRRVARPGSLIFLISDFRNLGPEAKGNLQHLSRHNDLVLIHLYDLLEKRLPPAGCYNIQHRNKRLAFDSGKTAFRSQYQEQFSQRLEQLETLCRQNRMRWVSISTTDDLVSCLHRTLRNKRP